MSCIPIINGPVNLYWGPVGEAFPDVGVTPAGNWANVGNSLSNHYTEDGVEIEFAKTFEQFRGLGNTYAICNFQTETDAMVRVQVAELSMETLRLAFNLNTVTVDAGPPAIEHISLDVGTDVEEMALLARGPGKSPEFDGGDIQLELNRVVERGSSTITFVKGGPAVLSLEFSIMLDTSGGFPGTVGRIVSQTA